MFKSVTKKKIFCSRQSSGSRYLAPGALATLGCRIIGFAFDLSAQTDLARGTITVAVRLVGDHWLHGWSLFGLGRGGRGSALLLRCLLSMLQ